MKKAIIVCLVIGVGVLAGMSCKFEDGSAGPILLQGSTLEKFAQSIECLSHADCDDSDVCTEDICTIEFACQNPRICDCCYSDPDCDDNDDVCTTESCVNNVCDVVNQCCEGNPDCAPEQICELRAMTVTYGVCKSMVVE